MKVKAAANGDGGGGGGGQGNKVAKNKKVKSSRVDKSAKTTTTTKPNYEFGSIAQLIAASAAAKSKKKTADDSEESPQKKTRELYDSELCKIFTKNSEQQKTRPSRPVSVPFIPTFTNYESVLHNTANGGGKSIVAASNPPNPPQARPAPATPASKQNPPNRKEPLKKTLGDDDVKLSNNDAAAIRIEAKLKHRRGPGPGQGQGQSHQGPQGPQKGEAVRLSEEVLAQLAKKKNKARKLRTKRLKELKKDKASSPGTKVDEEDGKSKSKLKGVKRSLSPEDSDEDDDNDNDEEVTTEGPSAKKKMKKSKTTSSEDDDEDAEAEDNENDEGEGEAADTAEDTKAELAKLKKTALTKEEIAALNAPKAKNAERESRTIFIGNVPTDTKKKTIKKLFQTCGKIEAVRFRGATPAKPNVLKKIAIRKNELHAERSSLSAYVRFSSRAEAEKAVEDLNGVEIKEHHLSLDLADSFTSTTTATAKDTKKAIFIGNLHLKTEDDEVWNLFSQFGAIRNVRLIRDQATGMGKGFGYVNFKTEEAVELTVEKGNGLEIRNRPLRVARCVKKVKGENKKAGSRNGVGVVPTEAGSKVTKQEPSEKPTLTSASASTSTQKKREKAERTTFGGDRLAEIGKLKRKSSHRVNVGDKKKASVARQLAGQSTPLASRKKKKPRKSQGERQRPPKASAKGGQGEGGKAAAAGRTEVVGRKGGQLLKKPKKPRHDPTRGKGTAKANGNAKVKGGKPKTNYSGAGARGGKGAPGGKGKGQRTPRYYNS